MDYFKLNNGTFIRVIDIKDGSWIIDMKAGRAFALMCNGEGLYVPMSDVAYEIDAVEMAIHMLKSMMQMKWAGSDKISRAIGELAIRFKDELVFNPGAGLVKSTVPKNGNGDDFPKNGKGKQEEIPKNGKGTVPKNGKEFIFDF